MSKRSVSAPATLPQRVDIDADVAKLAIDALLAAARRAPNDKHAALLVAAAESLVSQLAA